jgi:hypothetical protein
LITQIIGIVEEQRSISGSNGGRQIVKTTEIAPTNVHLWNVVTTCENTLGDASQVDLNALGPDVDEYYLKPSVDGSGMMHHLQVILARESCLHSKTLSQLEVFLG